MLSISTLLALIKAQSSFAALATAILSYHMAERARQYELVREMGTLACEIENRILLKKEYSLLQKQYDELAKLRSK